MDPIRNPYSPGAGTPPPELVGRDPICRNVDVGIQRMSLRRTARSVMLTGLRGVGKTVLLREFGAIAKRRDWTHLHFEATEDERFIESVAMLARKSMLQLSRGREVSAGLRRALGILKSFQLRWNIPDAGSIDLRIDPLVGQADSGAMEEDLADLFVEVGQLALDHKTGVLFTVDEIQYLSREHFAALIVALHRISQEQLPVMLIGAGLPSIPSLAGEAKSYAERLFSFDIVDRLSPDDARIALASPARDEGVEWAHDALELVVQETEGYPYFLQEFGKQAWDAAQAEGAIGREDVQTGIPIALDDLDTGFFAVRFDRTTASERQYLQAMASLGNGPYQSGEVAKTMGKRTTQVGPTRDTLIKRGLCYSPSYGVIDFTVPMFDQFLRRRLGNPLWPLASPRRGRDAE